MTPDLIPALIVEFTKHKHIRTAVKYGADKAGASLIFTQLEGRSFLVWANEMEAYRRLAPDCLRPIDHYVMTLDERYQRLSVSEWRLAGRVFSHEMGYEQRAVVTHRHVDEQNDHTHTTVLRIDWQGKVHNDSMLRWRACDAAARAAAEVGLAPLAPNRLRAPTDAQLRADARARRRKKTPSEWDRVRRVTKQALEQSNTEDELFDLLRRENVEFRVRRADDSLALVGWSLRERGCEEWLSGSELDSSLSWRKVQACLLANGQAFCAEPAQLSASTADREQHAENLGDTDAGESLGDDDETPMEYERER